MIRRFVPAVEQLECRKLLAVDVVPPGADDGTSAEHGSQFAGQELPGVTVTIEQQDTCNVVVACFSQPQLVSIAGSEPQMTDENGFVRFEIPKSMNAIELSVSHPNGTALATLRIELDGLRNVVSQVWLTSEVRDAAAWSQTLVTHDAHLMSDSSDMLSLGTANRVMDQAAVERVFARDEVTVMSMASAIPVAMLQERLSSGLPATPPKVAPSEQPPAESETDQPMDSEQSPPTDDVPPPAAGADEGAVGRFRGAVPAIDAAWIDADGSIPEVPGDLNVVRKIAIPETLPPESEVAQSQEQAAGGLVAESTHSNMRFVLGVAALSVASGTGAYLFEREARRRKDAAPTS